MSKSNTFENDLLLLVFNNTDITLIGDAAGLQNSAAAGSLYVSLHTSDPDEDGDQTTNETTIPITPASPWRAAGRAGRSPATPSQMPRWCNSRNAASPAPH